MADINVILTISSGITASVVLGTASTPPGGSDTQVQFNDGGAFGGMTGILWTKATKKLQLGEGADPILEEHYGKIYQLIQGVGTVNGVYDINCSSHNDTIITIDGNATIGLSNLTTGMSGLISMRISGIGGWTITLDPASFTTKLKGSDTIDNVTGKLNLISWWYDGTYVFYSVTNQA